MGELPEITVRVKAERKLNPWRALAMALKAMKRQHGLQACAFVRQEEIEAAVASGELVEVTSR